MNIYAFTMRDDGPYNNGDYESRCGDIYLHGKLDKDNGYDHCGIFSFPDEDGIYDCKVMMPNGDRRKAKLFYWSIRRDDGYGEHLWTMHRGLVVEIGDEEYMRDAQKKFDKRKVHL